MRGIYLGIAHVLAFSTLLAAVPVAAAGPGPAPGLTTISAAPCAGAGTPTTTIFLPNITKTLGGPDGWVTPFIVQNIGVKKTDLEVSFFRFTDGGLVACRRVTGLAPATSFADYPNNDVDLPGDSQFAVVVRSFGSEVVSVVNEHQSQSTPGRAEALSYNGLTLGASTVYLPFVGKPEPAPCTAVPPSEVTCNLRWLTTFVIQNFGSGDALVTARFTSYDGASAATLTRTIAPGRSRFVDPSVEPLLRGGRYYSVVLTSTQAIGVIVNAHDDAPTTTAPRGFSYNGIPQPAPGDTYLPYVRRDGGPPRIYPNGVLVQNAGNADATPTLSFQRLGGGAPVTIAAPSPLKPGAAWYFDPEVYAVAGGYQLCAVAGPGKCIGIGEHSLVVSGGSFAVIAATLGPGTAMGYVGQSAQGNRAYLPNVTRTLGGPTGWTTPIILQSSGATNAKLRWYRFADGALMARQSVGPLARGAALRVDPRSVPGLSNDTQYGVVVDAQEGNIAAIVTELNFDGGDGAMIYEGFPVTVSTVPTPTAVTLGPASLRLSVDETAQLRVTVKDQFDEAMPQQMPIWTVTPPGLGTVSASGLFTAGPTGAAGTVTATAGAASDSIGMTVQAPVSMTVGGISFLVRTSGPADVYTEATISRADAASISTQINGDVPRIELDYGRAYLGRPHVYVVATDANYRTAQAAILGVPQVFVTAPPVERFESDGVYYFGKVAINWSKAKDQRPITIARHELIHMMVEEIAGDARVPAWLNEGSARLEEFTVSGASWLETRERHGAVSMAATGQLLTLDQLTSQSVWNSRAAPAAFYQYAEASQAVQLLRTDVGHARQIRILELLGAGLTLEEAYEVVAGRSWAAFVASLPIRIRALAVSPAIAFAPDAYLGDSYGPTYVVYGLTPNSTLTLTITSPVTGRLVIQRQTDAYGVYWNSLSPQWPPTTYTFTVSSGATTLTGTYAKP
ncbi:MAG TPA: hypothetical protein VGR87_12395 [Candidatus Limnocylindria bacterium]|nr:hypothetical protein [Candidatus Limnocylindria bacterium]